MMLQWCHSYPLAYTWFLQRSALFARNADRCNSTGCPSVRPSVTFRCFVQTNEDTIMRSSLTGMGRTITLMVSEYWTVCCLFLTGAPTQRPASGAVSLGSAHLPDQHDDLPSWADLYPAMCHPTKPGLPCVAWSWLKHKDSVCWRWFQTRNKRDFCALNFCAKNIVTDC